MASSRRLPSATTHTAALVARALAAHGVAHSVIGATALAVHRVSRATAGIDLLVTDPRCFDAAVWAPVEAAGAAVDMRRGDADDPLAGVIRISRAEEPPVDVSGGRSIWQAAIIARAQLLDAAPSIEPLVDAAISSLPAECAALWRRIRDRRV